MNILLLIYHSSLETRESYGAILISVKLTHKFMIILTQKKDTIGDYNPIKVDAGEERVCDNS